MLTKRWGCRLIILHSQHILESRFDLVDLQKMFLSLEVPSGPRNSPFGPGKGSDFTSVVCFIILHPQFIILHPQHILESSFDLVDLNHFQKCFYHWRSLQVQEKVPLDLKKSLFSLQLSDLLFYIPSIY